MSETARDAANSTEGGAWINFCESLKDAGLELLGDNTNRITGNISTLFDLNISVHEGCGFDRVPLDADPGLRHRAIYGTL